jgi:hypothetical protein
MLRSLLAIGCVGGALLVPPSAAAGGWATSIRLDRTRVAVGDEVNAQAGLMFRSLAAAKAAQSREEQGGAFYVYLLRGFDYSGVLRAMRKPFPRNWWSVGSADAFRVGRVVIRGRVSNLALANASFRVPEVPPGPYAVMFCDTGCAHPLADVVPTFPKRFTVTAPEQHVPVISPNTVGNSRWIHAVWLVAGVVLGALLGLVLGRRGSPASLEPVVAAWQPSDDKELEELLKAASPLEDVVRSRRL